MWPVQLSAECQLAILSHALTTADPAGRQELRTRLRLVCRAWNEGIFRWKEVEAIELGQITGLVRRLAEEDDDGDPIGAGVKSAYVELLEPKGKDKVTNVIKLLGLAPSLSKVHFRLGHNVFGAQNEGDTLSIKLNKALQALARVKHFTLEGKPGQKAPMISLVSLKELADSWTKLRSVTLRHCELTNFGKPGPLAGLDSLELISLLDLKLTSVELGRLLRKLPPSLRHLKLTHPALYTDDSLVAAITAGLRPIASKLSSLVLTDPAPELSLDCTPRGKYDNLIASLTEVERLEIGPCALTHFAATLVPLVFLTEVRIRQGKAHGPKGVDGLELVQLVKRSNSLLALEMDGRPLRERWAPATRLAVANTADQNDVRYLREERNGVAVGKRVEPKIVFGGRGLGWSKAAKG